MKKVNKKYKAENLSCGITLSDFNEKILSL